MLSLFSGEYNRLVVCLVARLLLILVVVCRMLKRGWIVGASVNGTLLCVTLAGTLVVSKVCRSDGRLWCLDCISMVTRD